RPKHRRQRAPARVLPLLLRLLGGGAILLPLLRRQAHLLDHGVSARDDPAAVITRLEARDHRITNDDARHRVGQENRSAVAHLNAGLTLVGCNEKDHAIILALLADAPGATQPVAVILN